MPLPRRFSPPRRAPARAGTSKTLPFTLAAALACGLLLYAAASPAGASNALAPTPQTGLVNVTPSGAGSVVGANPGDDSITPDGRFVVFTSGSPDLTPDDSDIDTDVFVRDRRAGRTVLVSASRDGEFSGFGATSSPVITPDGRFVAFVSNVNDHVTPDPDGPGFTNVYLRDLQAGTTALVSRTPAGQRGNSQSGAAGDVPNLSISDDGRYVCFVSSASDLVADDSNSRPDVFVRDMQPGVTRLVSVNQAGTASANEGADYALMTPDGRFVAFRSLSNNLTANDSNSRRDVFLRDVQAGTTRLVSARPDGAPGNGDADPRNFGDLAVSADGRHVAFTSTASDLVAGDNDTAGSDNGLDVFVRDTVSGTTALASVNRTGAGSGAGASASLALTPDGRFVSFVSAADDLVANDTNQLQDVFVRDLQANTTALVTVNAGGAAAGIPNLTCEANPAPDFLFFPWLRPSISADGRFVAFASAASDLTATPDANCFASPSITQDGYDIFVRDLQAGSTRLVTANLTGEAAGAHRSLYPSITPDGRHVLFDSNADDLVPNDANGQNHDLFVNVNLPAAGQVRFAQQVFRVGEAAGQAVVTVTRTPGATGAATVAYTTLPGGTAAAGSEFTPASGTLVFAPGEESKQFVVNFSDDAGDEDDETVFVRLTDEAGGSVGEPALAAVVLADDDPSPRLSIGDARVGEGDGGGAEMTFLVTLSGPSPRPILVSFVTQSGTATQGSDFEFFGNTYVFPPGATRGLLKVRVFPDTTPEPDETFSVVFSNPVNVEIADGVGVGTIVDDDGAAFTKVALSADAYTVTETAGRLDVPVTRTGDLSGPSSVNYWSFDLSTSSRTDYTAPAGVIKFAAGESSKTLTVFVTDDAFRENDDGFLLILYGPEGCTLGAPHFANVTVKSDDAADGPSPARQQGDTAFFVRQHYRDFLGRDPDAAGLQFWTNEIESCGTNQQCREVKRVNVSAAFFLSIEFQQTGYLAYKTHKAAYGSPPGLPPINLFWFVHGAQQIGRDVVVNQGDWAGQLEQNKREYFDRFARDEFFNLVYPASLTAAEFVGALDANAGGVLTAGERAELAAALAAGTKTRAEVLRALAENAELSRREFNRAFVLMQYFGYLRRNPNEFPDADFSGYNFWLGKLEEFNGDYIAAEMVKAFINSDEYLKRFGQ